MQRAMAIGLLVNAALLAGVLLKPAEVILHAAGGGGGVPAGNGDVNGDGKIDISDAVYTLGWLFAGGPGPVAIECPPAAGKGLPATGMTQCYDVVEGKGWTEVPCAEAADPGQDGFYQAGCPSEGRFVDNGDGTVTDNCTALMWQKETADVNGDGQVTDDDQISWEDARVYCNTLGLAGHGNWRAPTASELLSIVNYGRFDPAIDPIFGAFSAPYFSSEWGPLSPLGVEFHTGVFQGGGIQASLRFVRAVRSTRFIVNGDGTTTDTLTGLQWQSDYADMNGDGQVDQFNDGLDWWNALAYCEKLTLGGHDDWRLPNVREINSLLFSDDPGAFGWSSTSCAEAPDAAWTGLGCSSKGDLLSVRAVRTAR